ncbi:MAG TPA: hypothetical protein DDY91_07075, partial [Planctomycetaceae bacterium]|nr:hypothetical protein [Planctomycetaceae bacterium]
AGFVESASEECGMERGDFRWLEERLPSTSVDGMGIPLDKTKAGRRESINNHGWVAGLRFMKPKFMRGVSERVLGALDQENRRERAEIDPLGSRDPSLALDALRIGLDRILVRAQESEESIDGCRWVRPLRFMKPKFVGARQERLGESTAGGDRRENARFRRPGQSNRSTSVDGW